MLSHVSPAACVQTVTLIIQKDRLGRYAKLGSLSQAQNLPCNSIYWHMHECMIWNSAWSHPLVPRWVTRVGAAPSLFPSNCVKMPGKGRDELLPYVLWSLWLPSVLPLERPFPLPLKTAAHNGHCLVQYLQPPSKTVHPCCCWSLNLLSTWFRSKKSLWIEFIVAFVVRGGGN